jgi:hypothetical protein
MESQARWSRTPLTFIFGSLCLFTFFRIFATISNPVLGLEFQTMLENSISFEMLILTFMCQCGSLLMSTLIVFIIYYVIACLNEKQTKALWEQACVVGSFLFHVNDESYSVISFIYVIFPVFIGTY